MAGCRFWDRDPGASQGVAYFKMPYFGTEILFSDHPFIGKGCARKLADYNFVTAHLHRH